MLQEVGPNSLKGKPYKLDTVMFYLTNPIWTAPDGRAWEEALKELFVIDTSPFPGETAMFADLILPDHTYLERLQDAPTYPFQGWPMAQLRVPAIKPLYDTKYFGDTLIEIGKRIKGRTGEYYQALGDNENVIRHLAKGSRPTPGTTASTASRAGRKRASGTRKITSGGRSTAPSSSGTARATTPR
jgi:thiosulfate reductase/polysulfide reductase chain A